MKKVDLIVHAPHFFTMEGEGVGYKTDVSMVVNSGKIEGFITAEEEKEYKADEVLDSLIMQSFRDLSTAICIRATPY